MRKLALVFLVVNLIGCEGYFGTKTDKDFIDKPTFQVRDIAYVPIQPALTRFVRPTDVLTGFDELLYVVDQATEEIVSLDESGKELARFKVQGVKAIAQDRRFNLLAIGTKTDTISGTEFDLTCIYRIGMQNGMSYGLNNAKILNEIVHPFYYKTTFSSTDSEVEFNSIGVLADNRYYVTRTGPGGNSFDGPDDAMLLFGSDDKFITPIAVSSNGALFRDYFKDPFGVITTVQPPQLLANGGEDFLFSSLDPSGVIKVQYIEFIESEFGATYEPRVLYGTEDDADGFLSTPFKFEKPSGMALSGDGTNHIFITDSEKDSLYLFSLNGFEGVKPPPGYSSARYINVSFGGHGEGLLQFNEPMGVAYKNRVVYVADAGNGRVLRFKLTSDFD
jgi:hypothetical protein